MNSELFFYNLGVNQPTPEQIKAKKHLFVEHLQKIMIAKIKQYVRELANGGENNDHIAIGLGLEDHHLIGSKCSKAIAAVEWITDIPVIDQVPGIRLLGKVVQAGIRFGYVNQRKNKLDHYKGQLALEDSFISSLLKEVSLEIARIFEFQIAVLKEGDVQKIAEHAMKRMLSSLGKTELHLGFNRNDLLEALLIDNSDHSLNVEIILKDDQNIPVMWNIDSMFQKPGLRYEIHTALPHEAKYNFYTTDSSGVFVLRNNNRPDKYGYRNRLMSYSELDHSFEEHRLDQRWLQGTKVAAYLDYYQPTTRIINLKTIQAYLNSIDAQHKSLNELVAENYAFQHRAPLQAVYRDIPLKALSSGDLAKITINRYNFNEVDFIRADFAEVKQINGDFSNGLLLFVNFKQVDLTNSKINEADLTFAIFQEANLERVAMKETNLDFADLRSAIIGDNESFLDAQIGNIVRDTSTMINPILAADTMRALQRQTLQEHLALEDLSKKYAKAEEMYKALAEIGRRVNFERPDQFYPRNNLANLILKKLETGKVALTGIFGLGKSSLAQNSLRDYLEHHPDSLIWQFDASSKDTLEESYLELANNIGIEWKSNSKFNGLVNAIATKLANNQLITNIVLFFDNAFSYEFLAPYIPTGLAKCKILVTSQQQDFFAEAEANIMENQLKFTPEEAINFLTNNKPIEEITQTDRLKYLELAEMFDHLPIGLAIAKDYIYRSDTTLEDYYVLIKGSSMVEAKVLYAGSKKYSPSLNKALELALAHFSPENLEIFYQTAFLSGQNIPLLLLPNQDGKKKTLIANDFVINSKDTSLVKINGESVNRVIVVHEFVQINIRILMTSIQKQQAIESLLSKITKYFVKDTRFRCEEAEVFSKSFGVYQSIMSSFNLNQLLLPHVTKLLQIIDEEQLELSLDAQLNKIKLFNVLGYFYSQVGGGNAQRSESWLMQAKIEFERITGLKELATQGLLTAQDLPFSSNEINKVDVERNIAISEQAVLHAQAERSYHYLQRFALDNQALLVNFYPNLGTEKIDWIGQEKLKNYYLVELYVSILYSLGRSYFYDKKSYASRIEDFYAYIKLSNSLSNIIEQNTGIKIIHQYLTESNGLLYFAIEDPTNKVAITKAMIRYVELAEDQNYYYEEGRLQKTPEIEDHYSKMICYKQAARCSSLLDEQDKESQANEYLKKSKEHALLLEQQGKKSEKIADLANQLGNNLLKLASNPTQLMEAKNSFLSAYIEEKAKEVEIGKIDYPLFDACAGLSKIELKLCNYTQAQQYFKEAEAIAKILYPEGHPKLEELQIEINDYILKSIEGHEAKTKKAIDVTEQQAIMIKQLSEKNNLLISSKQSYLETERSTADVDALVEKYLIKILSKTNLPANVATNLEQSGMQTTGDQLTALLQAIKESLGAADCIEFTSTVTAETLTNFIEQALTPESLKKIQFGVMNVASHNDGQSIASAITHKSFQVHEEQMLGEHWVSYIQVPNLFDEEGNVVSVRAIILNSAGENYAQAIDVIKNKIEEIFARYNIQLTLPVIHLNYQVQDLEHYQDWNTCGIWTGYFFEQTIEKIVKAANPAEVSFTTLTNYINISTKRREYSDWLKVIDQSTDSIRAIDNQVDDVLIDSKTEQSTARIKQTKDIIDDITINFEAMDLSLVDTKSELEIKDLFVGLDKISSPDNILAPVLNLEASKALLDQIKEKANPPILDEETIQARDVRLTVLIKAFADLANIYVQEALNYTNDNNELIKQIKIQYYTEAAKLLNYALSISQDIANSATITNPGIIGQIYQDIELTLEQINLELIVLTNGDISRAAITSAMENARLDKEYLAELRGYAKTELARIDELEDAEKITSTRILFEYVTQAIQDYLAKVYRESEVIMGTSPCAYTVIGLGSMALEQMTPYSDLEFAILTENDEYKNNPETKAYFRDLTHLVNLRIINLGETVIHERNIGGAMIYDLIHRGVNLDLGGKIPLVAPNKPELIHTVEGTLSYVRNEANNPQWLDTSHILEATSIVYGSTDLYDFYQEGVNQFLFHEIDENGVLNCNARALKRLKEGVIEKNVLNGGRNRVSNLEEFAPKLLERSETGKLFDAKQEIYRLPDRLLYNLALLYGIRPSSNWDTIDQLYSSGIINKEAVDHLYYILNFATSLRLRTYLSNQGQKENVHIFDASILTSQEEQVTHLSQIFYLPVTDLLQTGSLFEYYYTAMPLHQKLVELSINYNELSARERQEFLQTNIFYDNNNFNTGCIYYRLAKYRDAQSYLKKSLANTRNSVVINEILGNIHNIFKESEAATSSFVSILKDLKQTQQSLQNFEEYPISEDSAISLEGMSIACCNNGEFKNAIKYAIYNLKIRQFLYEGKIHAKVADAWNNLGEIYSRANKIEEALKCHLQSLAIRKVVYKYSSHMDVATSFNNLGIIYGIERNYDKALRCFYESLNIKKLIFKSLIHPVIINALGNLAMYYRSVKKLDESIKYFKQCLEIMKIIYTQAEHPRIALTINNLGVAYRMNGEFDKAIACHFRSLEIRKEFYKSGIHLDIADSLNDLGNTFDDNKEFDQAIEYHMQSLVMRIAIYQDIPHRDIASSCHNLGDSYKNKGDFDKAIACYSKGLEIEKILYKNLDHRDIVDTLSSLGNTCVANKDFENAIHYYKRCLETNLRIHKNIPHVDIVESLYSLISVYKVRDDISEIIFYYTQALIFSPTGDLKIKSTINHDLGCMYHVAEMRAKDCSDKGLANEYYQKAEEFFKLAIDNNREDISVELHVKYANFLYQNQRYEEAILYIMQVIANPISVNELSYGQMEKSTLSADLQNEIEFYGKIIITDSVVFAYYLLINAQIKLNNVEQASELVEQFKVYITSNTDPLVYSMLGYSYKNLEKFVEAAEAFKRAASLYQTVEDKPEYILAQENQAICLSMISSLPIVEDIEIRHMVPVYQNPLFNYFQFQLIYQTAYQIGGVKAINDLIELSEDVEVAKVIIETTKQYGTKHVLNIMFAAKSVESPRSIELNGITTNKLTSDEPSSNELILSELATQNYNLHYNLNKDQALLVGRIFGVFEGLISKLSFQLDSDVNWQIKKFIYHHDIMQFNAILRNNGIDKSIDILRDHSDFRKSVLLKLHPDKGGKTQDFVFIKGLQEKFSADLNLNQLFVDKMQAVQPAVYKAGIGFKILDTIIDTVRLVYEPTIDHTKKLAFDSAYLYSMYSGVNGYSFVISASDVLYKSYQGEYIQALKQAVASASYMALPTIIGYTGIPYIGFVYGASMMIYTGYDAVTNAYSFYQEYGSVEFELKSATAYKDLTQVLTQSSLQQIHDFTTASKKYEIKINNINLDLEKAAIKAQLEAKGEFGQKLYDYIYVPVLEEKYDLLNKVIEGSLTAEQSETLKIKHIKITLESHHYEHCMEIKGIEITNGSSENTKDEHYYCYDNEQQILDHLVIGETKDIEVVQRL